MRATNKLPSDMNMQCRLCGSDKKLIKAHVIPEGFFRLLRDENRAPEIHTNTPGLYPRKAPVGVYDLNILCGDCEIAFGGWDAYAQELLLRDFEDEEYVEHQGQRIALRIPTFDYTKLKLFFVSLLWRASVSTQGFYTRIRTGPFEAQLKKLVLAGDPAQPGDFAVSLARFEHPLGQSILDPHPERVSRVNYVRFYLGGFVAYIKVDQRPAPGMLDPLKLTPHEPLHIVLRNLERSKELPLMRRIVESTERVKKANNALENDRQKR